MLYKTSQERRDHDKLLEAMDAMDYEPSCTNYPDAYFPEGSYNQHAWETKWAISMCNECPIQQICAEYGMKWEVHGIWGGTTPKERSNWRRANNRSIEYDRPVDEHGKRLPIQRLDGKKVRKTA